MREGVVPELEAGVEPLGQERDALRVDLSPGAQLRLVDEADGRYLIARERREKIRRDAAGTREIVAEDGRGGKIVNGDRDLAAACGRRLRGERNQGRKKDAHHHYRRSFTMTYGASFIRSGQIAPVPVLSTTSMKYMKSHFGSSALPGMVAE